MAFKVHIEGEVTVLDGFINEDADLTPIPRQGALKLDFAKVTGINSIGAAKFMEFVAEWAVSSFGSNI